MIDELLYTWTLRALVMLFFVFVWYRAERKLTISKKLLWVSIAGYAVFHALRIIIGALLVHHQWSHDAGIGKYYTVEYSDKIYEIVGSAFQTFGLAVLFGLLVGIILFFIRRKWNYLLSPEENLLVAFGVMIAGWPVFLVFLALVFLLTVVRKALLVALHKEATSDRIVIIPAIPLAVIVVLLWGNQLAVWTGLYAIR